MWRRLWRRARYGRPVIVVSGLPRSGTSMTMRMLAAGGVALVTDEWRAPDEDNPAGYFEDERIKRLDKSADKDWLRRARGRAIKVISHLLGDLPATNTYEVLFMHRDLTEVLASQRKMLERRGEPAGAPDERLRELFAAHLEEVRSRLRQDPLFEVLELDYREVVADPAAQATRIREFLGRPLDVDAMTAAVDERLYRNRAEVRTVTPPG